MSTPIGTTLQSGKYRLEQELGQGGFGITYLATHQTLGHRVVIKTLNHTLRQDPNFLNFQQQFHQEAQRLAQFSHPNIVRVSDFFVEADLPYIVMDYVPGPTLKDVVQPHRPLPQATAIDYIRQIGAALQSVHQHHLLHRDVKPNNIILREGTQQVVLIDFGIAREFTPDITQTHTGILSAGYAPIEQYLPRAKRTPATDVYGLAATFYTLLTGAVPTAAPLRQHQPIPAPHDLRPDLHPQVSQAVIRGMALEAHDRPATIADWLMLLPATPSVALHSPPPGSTLSAQATLALAPQLQSPDNNTTWNAPPPPNGIHPTYPIPDSLAASGAAVSPLAPVVPLSASQPLSAAQKPDRPWYTTPWTVAGLTSLGLLLPILVASALFRDPPDSAPSPSPAATSSDAAPSPDFPASVPAAPDSSTPIEALTPTVSPPSDLAPTPTPTAQPIAPRPEAIESAPPEPSSPESSPVPPSPVADPPADPYSQPNLSEEPAPDIQPDNWEGEGSNNDDEDDGGDDGGDDEDDGEQNRERGRRRGQDREREEKEKKDKD